MIFTYFPKFHLILINGNKCFAEAFLCFLNKIYELNLYNNNYNIDSNNQTLELLNNCLHYSYNTFNVICKDYVKQHKLYANIVFYFSLKDLEQNQEIFNFVKKQTIINQTKLFFKTLKTKKNNYFIHKKSEMLLFNNSVENNPTGKIIETLNIINFNFL